VRRHRTAVIAASVVAVALVSGLTVATVGFVRAKQAQQRAEAEARRATAIKTFLTGMLAEARPEKAKGRDVTVREVVDSTLARIDRKHEFADDPLVLADILHALGETYRSLNVHDRAIALFTRAVELKRSAPGNNEKTILVSLNKLSETQAESGDLAHAIETQKEVVALAEHAFGRETDQYSGWLSNLGNMYADTGDLANAERILRESLAIDRKILGPDNEDMPFNINNLATILVDEGKCADAIPLHEESLALRRRFFTPPSAEVAIALGNYARALDCAGRHAEAEPLLRAAVATFSATGERFWRTGDARAVLGEVLLAIGRSAEGVNELTAGWEILTETTGGNTRRSREIATVAAHYYESERGSALAQQWQARAGLLSAP